jgi:hypothetical protein
VVGEEHEHRVVFGMPDLHTPQQVRH